VLSLINSLCYYHCVLQIWHETRITYSMWMRFQVISRDTAFGNKWLVSHPQQSAWWCAAQCVRKRRGATRVLFFFLQQGINPEFLSVLLSFSFFVSYALSFLILISVVITVIAFFRYFLIISIFFLVSSSSLLLSLCLYPFLCVSICRTFLHSMFSFFLTVFLCSFRSIHSILSLCFAHNIIY
jgi:hypothetical protein